MGSQAGRIWMLGWWVRAGALFGVAALSATCASRPPAGPAAVDSPAPPSATSSASGSETAPGTTPGEVQCAAERCDLATQICCVDEETNSGRCVAKTGGSSVAACAGAAVRECDESSDCAGGASCCRDVALDECALVETWSCRPGGCGAFGALSEEVCLLGGSCKSGPCAEPEAAAAGSAHGFCPAVKTGIPCGDATCAVGEGCCWDTATKRGSCVKDNSACQPDASTFASGASRNLYWCRSGADCGGGFECFNTSGSMYYSEFSCGHSQCHPLAAVLSPLLCTTPAECPETVSPGQGDDTFKLTGCETNSSHMPGVKSCTYQ